MIFRNTTDYDDGFLRAMLRWCIKQVEVPKSKLYRGYLREIKFTKCARSYRGLAGGGRVLVRIGAAHHFPANVAWRPCYRSVGMTEWMLDRDAVLVHITAHELAHIRLGRIGNAKNNEHNADSIARYVTNLYLKDRDALMAQWRGTPGPIAEPAPMPEPIRLPVPETPAAIAATSPAPEAKRPPTLQERRAVKAAAMLAKWERKLKIAARKVKAYRRKCRYYARVK